MLVVWLMLIGLIVFDRSGILKFSSRDERAEAWRRDSVAAVARADSERIARGDSVRATVYSPTGLPPRPRPWWSQLRLLYLAPFFLAWSTAQWWLQRRRDAKEVTAEPDRTVL